MSTHRDRSKEPDRGHRRRSASRSRSRDRSRHGSPTRDRHRPTRDTQDRPALDRGREDDRLRHSKRPHSPSRSPRHRQHRDGDHAGRQGNRDVRAENQSSRGHRREPDQGYERQRQQEAPSTRNRSPPLRNRSPPRGYQQQEQHRGPGRPHMASGPVSDAPPPIGTIVKGSVHTVRPFGMFVAIPGYRRHVLVHSSQVSEEIRFDRSDEDADKVKAMEFYFPPQSEVWVKVTEMRADERTGDLRVNGSLKVVNQEDGTDLDPTGVKTMGPTGSGPGGGSEAPPEVGTMHRCTVKRIEAYGVFVALDGFRKHGLVHSSQVSNHLSFSKEDSDEEKKAELAGVVAPGDVVWVKVVEVSEDDSGRGPKIGCSMKLAGPKGEDLDPMGSKYRPRGEGGDGPGGRGAAPIGSNAAAVASGGKVDWGHLAADNRHYVNTAVAAKYSFLEQELPPPPPRDGSNGMQQLPPPPLTGPPPGWLPEPVKGGAIQSVQQALAIVEAHAAKSAQAKKAKSKKEGKEKTKRKKDKSDKSKKHKSKDKKAKKDRGSESDSGTSSG